MASPSGTYARGRRNVCIELPLSWAEELDSHVAQIGSNRSAVFRQALVKYLAAEGISLPAVLRG